MKEKRIAVYAGTFDPITNGHLWMIRKGADLFDHLIVAIGVNPKKTTMFSLEERGKMLEETIAGLPGVGDSCFSNQYLINYAMSVKAQYILRGIRDEEDFVYERKVCNINLGISSDITTVFLTPPSELVEVSSSTVKELIGPQGWEGLVARYVPGPVLEKLKEKHYAKPAK